MATFASDPTATLAAITERESALYDRVYAPALRQTVAGLDDTSVITAAREAVGQTRGRALGLQDRAMSRYGSAMTPAQREAARRNLGLVGATQSVNTVNTAVRDQRVRNENFRNELINIGRGVAGDVHGVGQSLASNQMARQQQYEAQKAQRSASIAGSVGAIGSAAAMMAVFAI